MLKLVKTKTIPDTITNDNLYINSTNGKMYLDTDDKRISLGGASTDSSYPNTAPGDINYVGRFDIPNENRSIDRSSVSAKYDSSQNLKIFDCGYYNDAYWAVVFRRNGDNAVVYDVYKSTSIDFSSATQYGLGRLVSISPSSSASSYSYKYTAAAQIVKQPSGKNKLVIYILLTEVSNDTLAVSKSIEVIHSTSIDSASPNWTIDSRTTDRLVSMFNGSASRQLTDLDSCWMHCWQSYLMITWRFVTDFSSSYYRGSVQCYSYDITSLTPRTLEFNITNASSYDTTQPQSSSNGCPMLFSDTYCAYLDLGTSKSAYSNVTICDITGSTIYTTVIGSGSDGVPNIFRLSSDKRQVIYGYDNDYKCEAIDLSSPPTTYYNINDAELSHGKTYTIISVDGLRNYAIAVYAPFGVEHLYYLYKTDAQNNESAACVPLKSSSIRMFSDSNGEYLCVDNLDGTEDRYQLYTP